MLTFTNNAANKISELVIGNFFTAVTPLATDAFDNGERGIDNAIYCGMRVVITQNRDKENDIINGHANTMCKAQGQTLSKAALWFDIEKIPPGSAYVTLSRVKKLADIFFITLLKPTFFRPVTT